MRTATLAVALLVTAAALPAQDGALPPHVRAAADRISAVQLQKDLEFLASDELLGRNTASEGYDKAADFIVARLKKAGLRPLGDDGSYLQRYTVREWKVDVASAVVEASGQKLRLGTDFVLRSFARPLTGEFAVVYVGHGWVVPERRIDPYAGLDVRGKLLLVHGPRALPKGVEIQQIGRINVGGSTPYAEAEKRGAAGILFVPQQGSLENWDQMKAQNTTVRELDPRVPSAYAAQPVTSALLSEKAAAAVLSGEQVEAAGLIAAGDRQEYPASFELTKRLTVNVPAASTVLRPHNVVALLEGADPALKTEYVTIEAHLDGAVGTRAVEGDAIYNSADDNASGSAAAISIAEQMASARRPKRSVIFIWDSGEERGLWGTRQFVGNPPVPLDRLVAHFNIDMIGANRAPGSPDAEEPRTTGPGEVYVIGPGVLSRRADELLERVNREYLNLRLNRDHDRPESEFFYPRTDAGPFLERGILTIGFTTGIHRRYHLPSDEARHLDPKKMEAIARTAMAVAWAFADAPERPGIDKPVPHTVPRYR